MRLTTNIIYICGRAGKRLNVFGKTSTNETDKSIDPPIAGLKGISRKCRGHIIIIILNESMNNANKIMELIPTIRIIRVEERDEGTFGVVTICGQAFCVCLEKPDRLNAGNISNIPPGQYVCKKYSSPKFKKTFQVMDVVNRSLILFHKGNLVRDSRGCILLAQHFGKLNGKRAVLNSGKTFKRFMEIMEGVDKFYLTIVESY